mgnify:CR=1 FL=1
MDYLNQLLGQVVDIFTTYGIELGCIAVAGVALLGILKYCKVFAKIESEDTRHDLYLLISVGLSLIGSVIFLACTHQLNADIVFALGAAIWVVNQVAYKIYDGTPLRGFLKMLWGKVLEIGSKIIGNKGESTEEQPTTPEVTPPVQEDSGETGTTTPPAEEVIVTPTAVPVPVAATGLVYNGKEQVGGAASAIYTDTNGSATNAGEYTAIVTLKDPAKYKWATEFNGKLTYKIAKADYDMSGITMEDNKVTYDGQVHSITVKGTLPEGVAISYEGNNKTAAGVYPITASFIGDSINYNAIAEITATLTIEKAAPKISVVVDDARTIYSTSDFPAISLAEGSTEGVLAWEEGQSLKIGTNTYNWKFTPTDVDNYIAVVDSVQLTVVEAVERNISNTISFNENAPTELHIHLPALGKASFPIVGTDKYDISILSTYGVTDNGLLELIYRIDGKAYLPLPDEYVTDFEIDKQSSYFVINCTPDQYRYNKLLARKWGSANIIFSEELSKEYTYKMEVTSASGQKVTVYLEQE